MVSYSDLSERGNWQSNSGGKALNLERVFKLAFDTEFKNSPHMCLRSNPKEFKNIYEKVILDSQTEKEIYTPKKHYTHGIAIDFAIDNNMSGKSMYIEVKRQDGWVENLPSSAGRGNAHERLCKFFTPGLLNLLRKAGKTSNLSLPFWIVFGGNITRDPRRVREITYWFEGYEEHFFMWRDAPNHTSLLKHYHHNIRPLIS